MVHYDTLRGNGLQSGQGAEEATVWSLTLIQTQGERAGLFSVFLAWKRDQGERQEVKKTWKKLRHRDRGRRKT